MKLSTNTNTFLYLIFYCLKVIGVICLIVAHLIFCLVCYGMFELVNTYDVRGASSARDWLNQHCKKDKKDLPCEKAKEALKHEKKPVIIIYFEEDFGITPKYQTQGRNYELTMDGPHFETNQRIHNIARIRGITTGDLVKNHILLGKRLKDGVYTSLHGDKIEVACKYQGRVCNVGGLYVYRSQEYEDGSIYSLPVGQEQVRQNEGIIGNIDDAKYSNNLRYEVIIPR